MDLCLWAQNKTTVHRANSQTRQIQRKLFVQEVLRDRCFFCKTGHVATVSLEHRRTVNSEWYTTICLPKVRTREERIILYHGNASCHTSAQTSALLIGQNVELMGHSNKLNKFSLFPQIKKKLRAELFSSPEDGVFKNHVLEVSKLKWKNKHKWWSHIKTFWVALC